MLLYLTYTMLQVCCPSSFLDDHLFSSDAKAIRFPSARGNFLFLGSLFICYICVLLVRYG